MIKIKPKLYILPGWGGRLTDPAYKKIVSFARKGEFIPFKISTRNRKHALGGSKPLKWIVSDLQNQIIGDTSTDMIIGFSIGALQAYLLAQKLKFKKVILCSMSAVLGTDLRAYPRKRIHQIFSAQHREMGRMKYAKLASTNVTLLFGEKELDLLKERSMAIAKQNRVKAIEIKGADHELDSVYLKTLRKYI